MDVDDGRSGGGRLDGVPGYLFRGDGDVGAFADGVARVGLMDGYATFMKVIQDSPALRSRMWAIGQEVLLNLEHTLREETGSADDDMTPTLMAGQINWLHGTVLAAIGGRMVAGGKPSEVSRDMLLLLDEMEELLSEKVLNYAVRGAL